MKKGKFYSFLPLSVSCDDQPSTSQKSSSSPAKMTHQQIVHMRKTQQEDSHRIFDRINVSNSPKELTTDQILKYLVERDEILVVTRSLFFYVEKSRFHRGEMDYRDWQRRPNEKVFIIEKSHPSIADSSTVRERLSLEPSRPRSIQGLQPILAKVHQVSVQRNPPQPTEIKIVPSEREEPLALPTAILFSPPRHPKGSKWLMLRLGNDFSFLYIQNLNITMSTYQLEALTSFATTTDAPIGVKIGQKLPHIFVLPEFSCRIFLGPINADENLELSLICLKNGELYDRNELPVKVWDRETKGSWLYQCPGNKTRTLDIRMANFLPELGDNDRYENFEWKHFTVNAELFVPKKAQQMEKSAICEKRHQNPMEVLAKKKPKLDFNAKKSGQKSVKSKNFGSKVKKEEESAICEKKLSFNLKKSDRKSDIGKKLPQKINEKWFENEKFTVKVKKHEPKKDVQEEKRPQTVPTLSQNIENDQDVSSKKQGSTISEKRVSIKAKRRLILTNNQSKTDQSTAKKENQESEKAISNEKETQIDQKQSDSAISDQKMSSRGKERKNSTNFQENAKKMSSTGDDPDQTTTKEKDDSTKCPQNAEKDQSGSSQKPESAISEKSPLNKVKENRNLMKIQPKANRNASIKENSGQISIKEKDDSPKLLQNVEKDQPLSLQKPDSAIFEKTVSSNVQKRQISDQSTAKKKNQESEKSISNKKGPQIDQKQSDSALSDQKMSSRGKERKNSTNFQKNANEMSSIGDDLDQTITKMKDSSTKLPQNVEKDQDFSLQKPESAISEKKLLSKSQKRRISTNIQPKGYDKASTGENPSHSTVKNEPHDPKVSQHVGKDQVGSSKMPHSATYEKNPATKVKEKRNLMKIQPKANGKASIEDNPGQTTFEEKDESPKLLQNVEKDQELSSKNLDSAIYEKTVSSNVKKRQISAQIQPKAKDEMKKDYHDPTKIQQNVEKDLKVSSQNPNSAISEKRVSIKAKRTVIPTNSNSKMDQSTAKKENQESEKALPRKSAISNEKDTQIDQKQPDSAISDQKESSKDKGRQNSSKFQKRANEMSSSVDVLNHTITKVKDSSTKLPQHVENDQDLSLQNPKSAISEKKVSSKGQKRRISTNIQPTVNEKGSTGKNLNHSTAKKEHHDPMVSQNLEKDQRVSSQKPDSAICEKNVSLHSKKRRISTKIYHEKSSTDASSDQSTIKLNNFEVITVPQLQICRELLSHHPENTQKSPKNGQNEAKIDSPSETSDQKTKDPLPAAPSRRKRKLSIYGIDTELELKTIEMNGKKVIRAEVAFESSEKINLDFPIGTGRGEILKEIKQVTLSEVKQKSQIGSSEVSSSDSIKFDEKNTAQTLDSVASESEHEVSSSAMIFEESMSEVAVGRQGEVERDTLMVPEELHEVSDANQPKDTALPTLEKPKSGQRVALPLSDSNQAKESQQSISEEKNEALVAQASISEPIPSNPTKNFVLKLPFKIKVEDASPKLDFVRYEEIEQDALMVPEGVSNVDSIPKELHEVPGVNQPKDTALPTLEEPESDQNVAPPLSDSIQAKESQQSISEERAQASTSDPMPSNTTKDFVLHCPFKIKVENPSSEPDFDPVKVKLEPQEDSNDSVDFELEKLKLLGQKVRGYMISNIQDLGRIPVEIDQKTGSVTILKGNTPRKPNASIEEAQAFLDGYIKMRVNSLIPQDLTIEWSLETDPAVFESYLEHELVQLDDKTTVITPHGIFQLDNECKTFRRLNLLNSAYFEQLCDLKCNYEKKNFWKN